MDQNSNMGGFAPMPGQNPGVDSNGTVVMPSGAQAAPAAAAPGVGPAPATNNTPNAMPGIPAPAGMPGAPVAPVATQTQAAAVAAKDNKSALIETIILVVVCLIAAVAIVFAVIFFMQYNELNSSYESKVAVEVANARDAQKTEDDAGFAEKEKLPNYKFTGPSDYGSISFEYPKTWSVYVASDGSNNSDYVAYFRPSQVDPIEDEASRYALRFSILNQQINNVQQEYESKLEEGLTSTVFNADNNKISGTKYMGQLSENMQGIVVIFKVNDKTVVLQTDAMVYQKDFEDLISKLRRNS
jgi:hypothetical protein